MIKATTTINKARIVLKWIAWAIGIYVAMYGLALQRYNSIFDDVRNEANIVIDQLKDDMTRKNALNRIPQLQNASYPYKPDILRPLRTCLSLFYNTDNEYIENVLKKEVENYKLYLDGANLSYAKLSGVDLRGGSLIRTNFLSADLSGAKFGSGTTFIIKMNNPNEIDGTGLLIPKGDPTTKGANLTKTIFVDANLEGANFIEAENISAQQLCRARTLYNARISTNILSQILEICPQLLSKPNENSLL